MNNTLCLYDTEVLNPLHARIINLDYHYMAEQWVQDTSVSPNTQNPKRWVVMWELTDDETGTVLAIWTRPDGDTGLPSLTYTHPWFTGEWVPTPHKVFVAGTWGSPTATQVVKCLRDNGVSVTSTWHDSPKNHVLTKEDRRAIAQQTYKAIDDATLMVAVGEPTHNLRGTHTEIGYCIGKNKPVVLVSNNFSTMTEYENVTHSTPDNLLLDIARRSK